MYEIGRMISIAIVPSTTAVSIVVDIFERVSVETSALTITKITISVKLVPLCTLVPKRTYHRQS